MERADYYDAVDFDDSVYRTYRAVADNETALPKYRLVLIDEFQDFNKMKAALIDLLGKRSPIAIAGDDDQALYSQLRGACSEHIRERHRSGEYELIREAEDFRLADVV
jgi:DNA helicase-2/ATP-dependent DNA helicase PcrA